MLPVTLTVGCGSAALDHEDFPTKFEQALCEQRVACGFFPDAQTCRASTFLEQDFAPLIAAIEDGDLIYDKDQASACLDAIRSKECTVSSRDQVEDICQPVLDGVVELGGACTSGLQCAGDARCVSEQCDDACCVGVCQALPADAPIGGDCSDAACVDEAYCHYSLETRAYTCEERIEEDQSCQDFDSCDVGLVCEFDFVARRGTCVRPPAEGEACDREAFFPCNQVDNHCDDETGVCTPHVAIGGICDSRSPCVSYGFCDNGTCVQFAGQGEACDPELRACMGALDCVDSVCTIPPAEEYCAPPRAE